MAKENKRDPRIGHDTDWPETTMRGATYTRPATAIALGNSYFCVVDTFMKADERDELLEKLKALVAGSSKSTVKTDKDDDNGLA